MRYNSLQDYLKMFPNYIKVLIIYCTFAIFLHIDFSINLMSNYWQIIQSRSEFYFKRLTFNINNILSKCELWLSALYYWKVIEIFLYKFVFINRCIKERIHYIYDKWYLFTELSSFCFLKCSRIITLVFEKLFPVWKISFKKENMDCVV